MMRRIRAFLLVSAVLLLFALTTLFVLVATPMPEIGTQRDVFGFESLRPAPAPRVELERYPARDGERLAYRFYDSSSDTLLIFVHGSSYHGAAYAALAAHLSEAGVAKVYLPNLRGHYQSGRRRGDVDYVGQLEDDVADLIGFARARGHTGPVVLGGHSSGGGFAIRFAGGPHGALVSGFLLLAPVIPTAPTVKDDAGGWASLNGRRLAGLIGLNVLGVHGFDGLPIIEFNKPEAFRDGTETLAYTYRLNAAYHPRYPYQADLAAMRAPVLLLIGENDEANDAHAYEALLADDCPQAELNVLPGVDHFGVFGDPGALQRMEAWLAARAGEWGAR